MTYDLQFMPAARRDLKGLSKPIRERIAAALRDLMDNPRPPGVKKLVGDPNAWRIRIGQYRIVFEIYDRRLLVLVVRIGHRKDIYRR